MKRASASSVGTNQGFSHRNILLSVCKDIAGAYSVPMGRTLKLRIPDRSGIPFDPVVWVDEDRTLDLLAERLGRRQRLPRVIVSRAQGSVHTFSEGAVLSGAWPKWDKLPYGKLAQLADVLAALASIRWQDGGDFPLLPKDWPADGDSDGFLRWHIRYTTEQVEPRTWDQYGSVLGALNFPRGVMSRFSDLLPSLTPRPFSLLHGDLHPGNIVVGQDGSLDVIDWELAMMGDPLHDLAIHLERSCYPSLREEERLIRAWRSRVRAVSPEAVTGLERDLLWYRRFQAVRSVYTDVARTVDRLRLEPHVFPVEQASADLVRIVNRARWVLNPDVRVTRALARAAVAPALVRQVLPATVRCVLLDFDGPVCDLFAGLSADKLARVICEELDELGLLPQELRDRPRDHACHDPHALLGVVGGMLTAQGLAAEKAMQAQDYVHKRLGEAEVRAAVSAVATPHAVRLIQRLSERGYRVAIVSNNSAEAVRAYLRSAAGGGPELVPDDLVFGRPSDPGLMKPSPYLLVEAMKATGVTAAQCVFLGDSKADAAAAKEAQVRFFGYDGGVPRRRERLRACGVPEERLLASLEPLVIGVTPRT